MSNPAAASSTIIVKRPRKGGHGHHSSAWKVALADFMTAMMAFFLLLWLLATATPQQMNAIANYFNDPTATVGSPNPGGGNPALDGGEGILDGKGSNPFDQQSEDESAISHGDDASASATSDSDAAGGLEAIENKMMEQMLEELRSVITESNTLKQFADQMLLDMTPEGLRIQIADAASRPMFDQGAATLKPYFHEIIGELVRVVAKSDNGISISGHTDALQYSADSAYTNWELSADRANAARRALVDAGLPFARVRRVVGLGKAEPLDSGNPRDPLNRRISIVVLRSDFDRARRIDQMDILAPDDAGSAPDPASAEGATTDGVPESAADAARVPPAAAAPPASQAAGAAEASGASALPGSEPALLTPSETSRGVQNPSAPDRAPAR